ERAGSGVCRHWEASRTRRTGAWAGWSASPPDCRSSRGPPESGLDDLDVRLRRCAIGEDQRVGVAVVEPLERRTRLDDDERARRRIVRDGWVAEHHARVAGADDEDLLLGMLTVQPSVRARRIAPEVGARVAHVRVEGQLDDRAHLLVRSPAGSGEYLLVGPENREAWRLGHGGSAQFEDVETDDCGLKTD